MMNSSVPIFVPHTNHSEAPPSPPPQLANAWSSASNPILEAAMVTPSPSVTSSSNISSGSSRSSKSNSNGNAMIAAFRWLTAIHEATQCLRDQRGQGRQSSVEAIEYAIHYLVMLERLLEPRKVDWDNGPTFDPPRFVPYQPANKERQYRKKKKGKKNDGSIHRQSPITSGGGRSPTSTMLGWEFDTWNPDTFEYHRRTNLSNSNYNRFAIFDEDSEEENEEEDYKKGEFSASNSRNSSKEESNSANEIGTLVFEKDLEEAGDVPTLNRIANVFPTGNIIAMRRIMIRIVTAQSELFAYQARSYRRELSWALGAQNFHVSLWKINQGLTLANSEVSRCSVDEYDLRRNRQGLLEDADIVEVGVKSLTKERDFFFQKALAKKHQLIRKLAQNNISRNAARLRIGEERWCSNKAKSKIALEREEQERQAVEVGSALNHLIQLDTRSVVHSAIKLKLRLKPLVTDYLPTNHFTSKYQNRNNMTRPSLLADRVSSILYPDPSLYGWQFTGSCCEQGERVEFFEKQGMLLDWHYATAEMELSWLRMAGSGNESFYQSKGPVSSAFYMEVVQSDKAWEVANPEVGKNYRRNAGNPLPQGNNMY